MLKLCLIFQLRSRSVAWIHDRLRSNLGSGGGLPILEPDGQDVDFAGASAAIIQIEKAQAPGSGGSGGASGSAGGSAEESPNIDWGTLFGGWENW